jgi:hypothetical protein
MPVCRRVWLSVWRRASDLYEKTGWTTVWSVFSSFGRGCWRFAREEFPPPKSFILNAATAKPCPSLNMIGLAAVLSPSDKMFLSAGFCRLPVQAADLDYIK